MVAALRVFWETVVDVWDALIYLAILNLAWLGLSMTLILLPPATAALHVLANRLIHGRRQGWREFVDAMRDYFFTSWLWILLNIIALSLGIANVLFYTRIDAIWALALRTLFSVLLLFWLIVQFYVWPFLLEQEEPRLLLALRNAALTTLAAPLFSFTLILVAAVLTLVSLVLVMPLAFITVSFLAMLGNRAVLNRIEAFRKR